jgi:hypothetical protein
MNQHIDLCSSIEKNELYKMHYFVFPPTMTLKEKSVKKTSQQNFSVNSVAYTCEMLVNRVEHQIKSHSRYRERVENISQRNFVLDCERKTLFCSLNRLHWSEICSTRCINDTFSYFFPTDCQVDN